MLKSDSRILSIGQHFGSGFIGFIRLFHSTFAPSFGKYNYLGGKKQLLSFFTEKKGGEPPQNPQESGHSSMQMVMGFSSSHVLTFSTEINDCRAEQVRLCFLC